MQQEIAPNLTFFDDEIDLLEKELQEHEDELNCAKNENKNDWYVIAIPKKLHCQGLTYRERKDNQSRLVETPFLDEVKDYLDIVRKRWHEFFPAIDCYIAAIGAFRHLFRMQIKKPKFFGHTTKDSNKRCYSPGFIPWAYFDDHDITSKVDKLLTEHLSNFVQTIEGRSMGLRR